MPNIDEVDDVDWEHADQPGWEVEDLVRAEQTPERCQTTFKASSSTSYCAHCPSFRPSKLAQALPTVPTALHSDLQS
eukprot:1159539-Pelagomonas_calceolata.AAC.1